MTGIVPSSASIHSLFFFEVTPIMLSKVRLLTESCSCIMCSQRPLPLGFYDSSLNIAKATLVLYYIGGSATIAYPYNVFCGTDRALLAERGCLRTRSSKAEIEKEQAKLSGQSNH